MGNEKHFNGGITDTSRDTLIKVLSKIGLDDIQVGSYPTFELCSKLVYYSVQIGAKRGILELEDRIVHRSIVSQICYKFSKKRKTALEQLVAELMEEIGGTL